MEFERLGEHTIKCVISEEEILEMGFTIEDILQNGARTQQFMNQIFDLAEQNFEEKSHEKKESVSNSFTRFHVCGFFLPCRLRGVGILARQQ